MGNNDLMIIVRTKMFLYEVICCGAYIIPSGGSEKDLPRVLIVIDQINVVSGRACC